MFSDPRLIQTFASGFAFFISGLLCLFLFTAANKNKSARSFVFALLAIAIWGLFGFFFEITSPEKLELARVLRVISVIFIAVLTASVNNFSVRFYEENMGIVRRAHRTGLTVSFFVAGIIITLLISDLFKFSGFIVKGVVVVSDGILEPVPGKFFHFLYLYFFAGTLYTGFVLWMSRTAKMPFVKNQITWMLISIVIGLLAGGSRFMTWYGVNGSPAIASLAAPIFGIGFFYAIVKHHLFNIRVIATEILTFSIWGFLFLLIVFSETTEQRILNSALLLCVIILGIFLIRGTLREVGQREELAKANIALKNLNQNLEAIVLERTGELSRAKLHTDAIIENLVLGLIEYDNNFSVLRVNRAAEELLGFNRNNVVGKKITGEDVTDKELSSLAEVIHLNYAEKDPQRDPSSTSADLMTEITIRHPSPRSLQIITFTVASEEQNWSGERKQFVKIIRDVTREKLIDKNKSDFITIVAHQLRTPLSAIKWAFNMALETEREIFNKDQLDSLKEGYQANERMISLINDLLNVVYIEDGRFGYEFKQGDIINTVTDVVASMKTIAHWKKVALDLDLPSTPIPLFYFDAGRLSLALSNIIKNGINYTPPDKHVMLTVKKEGDFVKIIIKDNGIGIPQDDIQKLLITKFFRSVKALRAQTDGSGLGLFIANNIIKTHKGIIGIESEEDKGTTVSIIIPTTLTEKDAPPRIHTETDLLKF
ncbi:MAG: ATP-binding protein [bacterium]|nr:ATP-binding protein [bacterium]